MTYAIETKELSFAFAYGRKVVNELSLRVPEGSIYGFLGPNGAGKTTTIRLLTGMLRSDRDNIFLQGQSLQRGMPGIFQSLGALIETPSLYGHLTGKENLKVITTLRGLHSRHIDKYLSIVGLTDAAHKKAKDYSLGMKQRLGIAMALLPDPTLLILDEPANGLDPNGIIEIRELLRSLNREHGKTVFVSSHLLAEIEKTCTHIGIINRGVLRYDGTLEEMKRSAHASGEVIFTVPGATGWMPQVQALFTTARQQSAEEIIFPFADAAQVTHINQQLVQHGVPVTGIQVHGGLEEWFMHIVNQDRKAIA
ncbi:MAG TPA: ABC transporter ATP-binding protein [Chitinophagaceae bacterium]